MRVEINDGVTWRDLAGDVVILNVETGVYFGLDGAGGQIWRELVEHGSMRRLSKRSSGNSTPSLMNYDATSTRSSSNSSKKDSYN